MKSPSPSDGGTVPPPRDPNRMAGEGTCPPSDDDKTGLPGLRSWRSVYIFVLGCFVTYIVLLTVFGRYFA